MAVLIITHDLGVVANLADEVIVLYRGQVMEAGEVHAIFDAPGHPYLRALLRAVPHFDMKPGERLVPVREIDHQAGPLIKADDARTGERRHPARGRERKQDVRHAQGRLDRRPVAHDPRRRPT